jgi:HKD family nuclease
MSEPAPVARTLFPGVDGEALVFGLPAKFRILDEIKRSTSIRLATAYGKISGWRLLKEAVLKSKGSVYLLAGLDFGLTEPALLRQWRKLSRGGRIHAKVFDPGENFHPKALIVERQRIHPRDEPWQGFAIVGSGNLSGGGFLNNVECSLYTEDGGVLRRLTRWFDGLFQDERANRISASVIERHERIHQMARRHARETQNAHTRFKGEVGRRRRSQVKEILRDADRTRSPFFYVNTNIRYSDKAHQQMLEKGEAGAFYGDKELIKKIPAGAIVFLYRSSKRQPWIPGEVGIVAFGKKAAGKISVRPSYRGAPREGYFARLEQFRYIRPSVKAREIRRLSHQVRGSEIAFRGTSNMIDAKVGKKLYEIALRRSV